MRVTVLAGFTFTVALSLVIAGCGTSTAGNGANPSNSGASGENSTATSTPNTAPIQLKVGSTDSPTSIPGKAEQDFVTLVNKYSNGKIQAKLYPNGELGPFGQEATELKTNAINAIFIQPDALGGQVQLAQVDAWPFMFKTPDQMLKAWQGPGGQKVDNEIEKESGYYLTAPTWNSPRYIILNRSVNSLAQAKGMKVRVPGENVYLDQMKLLGLNAVGMNIADVYTGMQSNTVNGMEATLPDASSFKMQDVAKTIITDGHVIAPKMWLFWGKWLDGLTPSEKADVLKAAKEASAYYSNMAKSQNQQLIDEFKAKGVKFVSPGVSFSQLQQMEVPMQKQLPTLYKWAITLSK